MKEEIYLLKESEIKELATKFFYDWYNSSGTNTEQGFDEWWNKNKLHFKLSNNTAPEMLEALIEAKDFIISIYANIDHDEGFHNAMMNAVNRCYFYNEIITKALGE